MNGKDTKTGSRSSSLYGRIAQEFSDNYIIGAYAYKATNYTSDIFGTTSPMQMAMGAVGATTATDMSFKDVSRYGVDFALNYGEPLQFWGAYTTGKQTSYANQNLNVMALTLSSEWKFAESDLIGIKYDASRSDLQMLTNAVATPTTTTNTTLFGIHEIAENVQGILSVTRTSNQVDSMGAMAGKTVVRQSSFTTGMFLIDIAL